MAAGVHGSQRNLSQGAAGGGVCHDHQGHRRGCIEHGLRGKKKQLHGTLKSDKAAQGVTWKILMDALYSA